jgi:predicted site-specific integrase-resolvase
MQVARLYLRVSTAEQDLTRQCGIEHEARQAGYYIAGIYREKASGVIFRRRLHQLTERNGCCAAGS